MSGQVEKPLVLLIETDGSRLAVDKTRDCSQEERARTLFDGPTSFLKMIRLSW